MTPEEAREKFSHGLAEVINKIREKGGEEPAYVLVVVNPNNHEIDEVLIGSNMENTGMIIATLSHAIYVSVCPDGKEFIPVRPINVEEGN